MKRNTKTAILFFVFCSLTLSLLSCTPSKLYRADDFGIEVYHSSIDKDGDGIDDATDILQNVKTYLATSPQYKSAYYAGGWPTDEYGVCTDVVARGLLGAGYDLQLLVDEDRKAHPEAYQEGEKPDPNIDFRRVRNLFPYFTRNAISLTLDPKEISEWQPGDIVVWNGHIGVISEHRNKDGVALVYHHVSPGQKNYEQDVLETYGTIIGHFRIS